MPRSRFQLTPFLPLLLLAAALAIALPPFVRVMAARSDPTLELLSQVQSIIQDRYLEEVDSQTLLHGALRGMLGSLDDYCEFYAPEDLARLREQTTGEFGGIGVFLARDLLPMTIDAVMPGFSAAEAGLRRGDRILAVDGRALEGHEPDYGIDLVRGPVGSSIVLRILRPDVADPFDVTLERQEIPRPSVLGARILDPEAKLGYLRIATFLESTLEEFDAAMERLRAEGMEALVLDLRRNDGGLFDPARLIANRFLSEGILVSTQDREGVVPYPAAAGEARYEGTPLALLVDEETASAAEIVAGAIQDHGLGVLVGARTYGKGLVQTILRIEDYGVSMKLTTSQYVTPGGQKLERPARSNGETLPPLGLQPDLPVSISDEEYRAIAERLNLEEIRAVVGADYQTGDPVIDREDWSDPQLDAALAFLEGEPFERPIEVASSGEVEADPRGIPDGAADETPADPPR